jgi:peptidoglycan/LPS O-acetylase OafA/YrhL
MLENAGTQNYRADIDGLRAVAVVLVVAFHAFPGVVRGGFIGVDVFFVISGYLISGNILSGITSRTFTLGDFYMRRARRILPALAITLAGTLAIGWAVLLPSAYQALGLHALAGALFFPNFVFWNEVGYFDPAAETKPLLHLWSLGVEEQFYLIWPVLLMVLSKRPKMLLAALCAIVAASLVYSCYAAVYSPAAAFYSPLSRLWELGIGGILCVLGGRPRNNNLLSSAGIALIAASALLLQRTAAFPGAWAVIPVAGTALVIVSGSTILAHKLPELLGKISYPLYLWHWPLLSFAATNDQNSIRHRVLVIAVSLVLAWLTYVLIEKPIRFGRFRESGVAVSVAVLIGLAGFSAFAFFDGGIPARFPQEVRSVLALMKYNPATDARYPSCWLAVGVPFESYGAECRAGATVIWGDSHAARLYTGFKQSGTEVGQFTRDSCMPTLNDGRQLVCDISNAAIVEEIVRLKPKCVIIFAVWLNNPVNWQLHDERVESIGRAIKRLKEAVDDVVILGPSPFWTPDLPTAVFRFWVANRRFPERMQPAPKRYHDIDTVLAAVAHEHGARFISVFDRLCNEDGCLTHTPSSQSDLLSWDYGHLTTSGAHSVLEALQLN